MPLNPPSPALSALVFILVAVSSLRSVRSQQESLLSYANLPCYVVSAPGVVRPGQVYRIGVVLCQEDSMAVRAALQKDGQEISARSEEVDVNTVHLLILKTPASASPGNYTLTVEGTHPTKNLRFKNTTQLEFSPKFLSITVQTSRAIYRAGQVVLFRVLILNPDLTPFDDGVDIFVIDPDGFIMRRWISANTNDGVASLKFKLPALAKDGTWKIRVRSRDQIEEQNIKVETYFSPLFEVRVELPPYILDSEEAIMGRVYGLFTSEKMARGNLTLKLYAQDLKKLDARRRLVWEQEAFVKSKAYNVNIPLTVVGKAVADISGAEVTLEVSMTESLYAETVSGFCKSRIIKSALVLRLLSSTPAFFKPGMPFHSQIAVSYEDNEQVPSDILARSKVKITASFQAGFGNAIGSQEVTAVGRDDDNLLYRTAEDAGASDLHVDPISLEDYADEGVLKFSLVPPENAESVLLTASYEDGDGNRATASLRCFKYHSDSKKYLGVWTTTSDAVAGEYAVFHVKSNFRMSKFHYLVISKNYILNGGDVPVSDLLPTTTTFSVPLSAEMAPGFRLLVFHTTPENVVTADSVFLPVYGFDRFKAKLRVNPGKDFKGDTVEVIVTTDEGAYVGIHAVRSVGYQLQTGNDITRNRITESLFSFEKYNRSLHYVLRQSRNGLAGDETLYFPSNDYGQDLNNTFASSGLVVLAQRALPSRDQDLCPGTNNTIPCNSNGCYTQEQRCNGKQDCSDSSDEMNCPPRKGHDLDYRIERFSRFSFLYDADHGDWAWKQVQKNHHKGSEYIILHTPFLADDWYFSGFSVSSKYGLSFPDVPIVYSTKRPFTAHLSGPGWCHRGEQVGLRLVLMNNDYTQALVFVRLLGSPDYKFVHVEPDGIVSSYGARLSSGDHHLLVYIAPESQEQIDFPVAPTIEQGSVEVKFVASSQAARSVLSHTLEVVPEGVIIGKHTSVFLDLKSRAYVMNYLDIFVEESPIVPYQEWRRYVYGSPKASVSITGDIIGPAFPELPLTKVGILGMNGKGTDARMFEFAMNVWHLHYLRVTNQLPPSTLKQVLEESTTLFAQIMKRYNKEGSFSNWDYSQPSVWLTAWVLRVFKDAMYADWENVLYIESDIFEQSVLWLVKHQSPAGSFVETNAYVYPLDLKMKVNNTDAVLTAHVLITLCECLKMMEGRARSVGQYAAMSATRYLELTLSSAKDPYQLAITSYALTLAESTERDTAYAKLRNAMKQSTEGLIFWSRHEIPANPVRLENQRPFAIPRDLTEGDSEAVEATAYALLVLLIKDGTSSTTDKIVEWLSCMRMSTLGMVSMTDTIVATKALTEYVYQARLMDITKIDVDVNIPSNTDLGYVYHIGNNSESREGTISDIPNVWGHVNVIAKGAGLGLVQLDVSFGVDYEPLKDYPTVEAYDLTITEYYSSVRNKSSITIQSCLRWVRDWPKVSGASILEVDVPTGYHLVESEATSLVEAGIHPTLRDAQTIPGKTLWYFDHIPREWSCFNHTVKRWYPVANMTLHRQALLYEISSRERFVQIIVNSTPLYILNICEVCGSYQCPYCPYYNSVPSPRPHDVLYVILISYFMYTVS